MSYHRVEKFISGQWGNMDPFSPKTAKRMVREFAEYLVEKMKTNPTNSELYCMMLHVNFPVLGDIEIGADLKDKARDGEKDMIRAFRKAYKKDMKNQKVEEEPPGNHL